MPVLILRDRCDNLPRCFAASACPNQALFYDEGKGQVVVFPERCSDCRGPCLNFCDHYALKYAPSLQELGLLQAELDGSMSAEEIAQERLRLKQAEESRQKQAISEATALNFQQEVVQARLPVLLVVDSPRSPTWKRIQPILEQLAQQYVGQVILRRVNSDSELQLLTALRIRSVPTFLLFYQGQPVNGVEGALSLAQLQRWLQELLDQLRGMEESHPGARPAPAGRPGPTALR
jgi:thiol-disulfide isomerase/thioredoxin